MERMRKNFKNEEKWHFKLAGTFFFFFFFCNFLTMALLCNGWGNGIYIARKKKRSISSPVNIFASSLSTTQFPLFLQLRKIWTHNFMIDIILFSSAKRKRAMKTMSKKNKYMYIYIYSYIYKNRLLNFRSLTNHKLQ